MPTPIEAIPVNRIDGAPSSLADYSGKVRLVVNVASKCGLTPQYEALESLQKSYNEKGLEVLGFPANNFGAQEPGSNDEIADFCTTNFGVQFPMFEKISVLGADQHPLYAELTKAKPAATFKGTEFKEKLEGYGIKQANPSDVFWNFEKFLVSRDGQVVGRFAPDIAPNDPLITEAIEAELAK